MARGPIPHTCPDINSQQKSNDEMQDRLKNINLMRTTPDEIDDLLSEIRNLLRDNNDTLEDMRDNNDSLRTWGANMEDRVEELEQELKAIEQ